MARACGMESVHAFQEMGAWRAGAGNVLAARGPTVAVLEVEAVPDAIGPKSPGPTSVRGAAFMAALRGPLTA